MDAKRSLVRLLLVVPLLAVGIALGAPKPVAAATPCTNQTLTGTVKDSIVVTANSTCILNGATIRGGITIQSGAILSSANAEIRGAVSGAGVNTVLIQGGTIRGGVTLEGAAVWVHLNGVEVRGNVLLTGAAQYAALDGSIVRGSATVTSNNFAYVRGNTIETDLSCDNTNGTTNDGFTNIVSGAKLGQCANL